MIDRPDWGVPAAGAGFGGRETAGNALVPAATVAEPAALTREDLALVNSGDAEEDDEAEADRQYLEQGIFTREELARFRNRPVEEIAPLRAKTPSRQSIETELAAIQKDIRDNRSAYFKDEKKQARYRDLLTARDPAG